jgi:hypothetical protein
MDLYVESASFVATHLGYCSVGYPLFARQSYVVCPYETLLKFGVLWVKKRLRNTATDDTKYAHLNLRCGNSHNKMLDAESKIGIRQSLWGSRNGEAPCSRIESDSLQQTLGI